MLSHHCYTTTTLRLLNCNPIRHILYPDTDIITTLVCVQYTLIFSRMSSSPSSVLGLFVYKQLAFRGHSYGLEVAAKYC